MYLSLSSNVFILDYKSILVLSIKIDIENLNVLYILHS